MTGTEPARRSDVHACPHARPSSAAPRPRPATAPQPPRPELAKLAALVGYDLGTRAQEVAHAS